MFTGIIEEVGRIRSVKIKVSPVSLVFRLKRGIDRYSCWGQYCCEWCMSYGYVF